MSESDSRSRDRVRTEAAIVAAARDLLAEVGFQGFRINAVARRAGCDKQLIYRYFGGLDGVIDAIGVELAGWIDDNLGDTAPPASYGGMAERLILGFLDALRGDPLVQKIAVWELADPSPKMARLTQARGLALARWIDRTRGDLAPPPGVDAPALNILMIAAVQQLVLAGAAAGVFSGVPLHSDEDWERIRAAVVTLVRAAYGR